jgi:hypothetical protein
VHFRDYPFTQLQRTPAIFPLQVRCNEGLVGWDWVHFVRRPLFDLLCQSRMINDDDECGTGGGIRIGRGNRSTRRKPAPVPLCPPQIPHDLTWARTPGRRGGKPATNCLSYGTVTITRVYCIRILLTYPTVAQQVYALHGSRKQSTLRMTLRVSRKQYFHPIRILETNVFFTNISSFSCPLA